MMVKPPKIYRGAEGELTSLNMGNYLSANWVFQSRLIGGQPQDFKYKHALPLAEDCKAWGLPWNPTEFDELAVKYV